jgi:CelD/BcsL family acetyltransferase involved in cellulose biosynthesis
MNKFVFSMQTLMNSVSELDPQERTADPRQDGEDNSALPALTVEHGLSWEDIEALHPAWDAILGENPRLTPFASMEWMLSWWAAFGRIVPEFLVAREGDCVAGIAPLFRRGEAWLGIQRLTHLRLLGAGSTDSDNLDVIVRPGYEDAFLEALLRDLGQRRDWDVCRLETLREDSATGPRLAAALEQRGWPYRLFPTSGWCVELPRDWDTYVASLSAEFRPLVTRYAKRLDARYACRLRRCETSEELEQFLPVLFDLHQRRWRQAGRPGAFASLERQQFYRLVAAALLKRGWLDFWVLELDAVPAAAQFCCRYGDTVYLLQEGFSPDYAKDRVGYALRARLLRHYLEAGVKKYDFMGGSDPYKQKFGARASSYWNLEFARPRSRGALWLAAENAKEEGRSWLRQRLPAPLISRLRTLRARFQASTARPDESASDS